MLGGKYNQNTNYENNLNKNTLNKNAFNTNHFTETIDDKDIGPNDPISQNSIFISQSELSKNQNISGKVTLTNILETIPEGYFNKPKKGWRKLKQTEWRWRFLMLPSKKLTVEISYMLYNDNNRIYFNKYGDWVHRIVDPIYDSFVIGEYYWYA